MPMYEYECEKCGHTFEDLAGPDEPCPACGKCAGATRKVVSRPSLRVEHASPLDRGVAPLVGYNPTGRPRGCPSGGCGGGSCGGGNQP
ncbi:zinc ribbon domain-containing protein [Desulfocurvus sp.]|uniref:FmdB family zinc ribbon protein n=1 Tax=Desulfocurvus sp. TaxID=2871698 RepID=UPI0025C5C8DF|nr:zinc ribbon domain-containing protein [Desulfocurvus sp.]MCK9238860.1 zinc ribbon domain-containing protein [Desulfocurvus sp.]